MHLYCAYGNRFINSNFNYSPLIWHFCSIKNKQKLEAILKRALRCALDDKVSEYSVLLAKANMSTLEISRVRSIATEVYKTVNQLNASYISKYISVKNGRYNTRQQMFLPRVNTVKYGHNSMRYIAPKIWNGLPTYIRDQPTLGQFKSCLQAWHGITHMNY